MAAYPCQIGSHRYSGAQRSMYLTVVGGSSLQSRKLRLCPHHFVELLETVQERALNVEAVSLIVMSCTHPGCDQQRTKTILVKVFDQGEDPVEYVADLCDAHAPVLLELLGWNGAISL